MIKVVFYVLFALIAGGMFLVTLMAANNFIREYFTKLLNERKSNNNTNKYEGSKAAIKILNECATICLSHKVNARNSIIFHELKNLENFIEKYKYDMDIICIQYEESFERIKQTIESGIVTELLHKVAFQSELCEHIQLIKKDMNLHMDYLIKNKMTINDKILDNVRMETKILNERYHERGELNNEL